MLCTCGVCLTRTSVKSRIISKSCQFRSTLFQKEYSRCAKRGPSQEQSDHYKARDSTRNAKKKEYSSITARWHGDELYRNSQIAIGWTEERCQCLDSLMSNDFSYTAMRKERGKIESNLTLGVQWSRTKAWTNEEQGRFPTSSSPTYRSATVSGKTKSAHP